MILLPKMHPKTLSVKSHHLVLMANVKDAPFKCLLCKKVFISENHLRRHENRRHNLKTPPLSSEPVKERKSNETSDDSTIKAVLNATERIEDLLVKLAIRENENLHKDPVANSSPRSIIGDSQVSSSSFITEKDKKSSENSKWISNDIKSNKKPMEIVELKYKMSNFQDSLGASNSLASEQVELNIGDFEHNSVDGINITNPKEIFEFDYNKRKSFEDSLAASYSFAVEKNKENSEHISIGSIKFTNPKEIVNLEYNKRKSFEDSLAAQNIEKSEHVTYDTTQITKSKEIVELEYNEGSNFEDSLVNPNAFNEKKSKQNIENCEPHLINSSPVIKQEDLAKLENSKKSNFEDSLANSNAFTTDKSEQSIENSGNVSIDSISNKKQKTITKMSFGGFLEDQENKAIWRLTSSVIKSSNEVLDTIYSENELDSEKNDKITPFEDSYLARRPVLQCRSSLKTDILKRIDRKLESYGIDSSKNTLSYKDMKRIEHLMKEERDHIAEDMPDYFKLRQLIEHNAQRRIKENLRVHSTYIS